MTIIHHGLCHRDITVELQHRPADVGHAARQRRSKQSPLLINKCCLLPALLHTQLNTHRQMQITHTHKCTNNSRWCRHSHSSSSSCVSSLLFITCLPCNNAWLLSAIDELFWIILNYISSQNFFGIKTTSLYKFKLHAVKVQIVQEFSFIQAVLIFTSFKTD